MCVRVSALMQPPTHNIHLYSVWSLDGNGGLAIHAMPFYSIWKRNMVPFLLHAALCVNEKWCSPSDTYTFPCERVWMCVCVHCTCTRHRHTFQMDFPFVVFSKALRLYAHYKHHFYSLWFRVWYGLVFCMPFFFGVRMVSVNTHPFVPLTRERIVLPLAWQTTWRLVSLSLSLSLLFACVYACLPWLWCIDVWVHTCALV